MQQQATEIIEAKFQDFSSKYESLDAEDLISAANDVFGENLAAFSSFGSYSPLLLKKISDVNPNIPIVFLETGKHFSETIEFVETVKNHLGLTNFVELTPDEKILENADPNGNLWSSNVDRCCWIRKVEPLDRYLENSTVQAVITGRRSYQTAERSEMKKIELDDQGIIRINPFALWHKDKIIEQFNQFKLPQHPLVAQGYPSIGCAPCTSKVKAGEDERAGRWAHVTGSNADSQQKTECGIHLNREDIKDFSI